MTNFSMDRNRHFRLFSFPVSVVTIGFNPATYSVREDAGSISVTLSVQDGIQDRDVLVTLTTMNSTAMCESLKTEDSPLR